MSIKQVLKQIQDAVGDGELSSTQAKEMKQKLNIFQSSFTRKTTTAEQRKTKRQAQREARRTQRGSKQGKRWSPKRFKRG